MTSVKKETGIGTWVWEIPANTLSWDDGMYCIYGVDRKSFSDANEAFLACIHPEDQRMVADARVEATRCRSAAQYDITFRIVRPDGQVRNIKDYGVTQFDEAGKPIRQVGVNWDITLLEENQSQLAVQTAEIKNIRFALDEHAIVAIANARREIIYANDKFYKLSKYSSDELLGQDFRILNSGKHPKEFFERLLQTITQGETYHGEIQNKAKDGSYFWIAMTIVPFLDQSGKPYQYVTISTDITEQKKNEAVILEIKERIKLATEIAEIGIWVWDIIDNTLVWDDAMYSLYGIAKDDFDGAYQAWSNSLHPDDKELATKELHNALRSDNPRFDTTFRIIRPDGKTRYIRAHGVTQFDSSGNALRMIGCNADITELKKRTQEAELAVKTKSQFLANMSHEIRTPLTSIVGYCETLLDESLSASEQREAASAAFSSAKYLLSIVNDILDISRLEAGKTEVEVARANLFSLVDEIVTVQRKKIADKQLCIDVEYYYPLPLTFYTDLTALKQILVNISDNAIKFTECGDISIRVSFSKEKNLLSFSIADTGIGITPGQRSRLFQVFSQGDAETTRRFGGSGLGLAISKHLAFLLGGDITLESTPGIGSTFTVTIPAGAVSENDIVYSDQAHLQLSPTTTTVSSVLPHFSGKVLVVEDTIEIQKYVRFLLTKMGVTVSIVGDGERAVDAALNGEFCLIVMDMHLPGIDGHAATRLIREHGIKTPILALTADVREEHVERCFQSGCNDFLPKPFSRAGLVEKIGFFLNRQFSGVNTSMVDSSEIDFTKSMEEFVGSFALRIEELERINISREYESLTKNAHKLAGAAAFAYPVVYQPLLELNDASRQRNAENCTRLLVEIKDIHQKHSAP